MNFEEYLKEYGSLTYKNVGVSMLPLIKQGRDLFTLIPKGDERCKKYDVVLYRRPPKQYVLHRVVKVRENDYVILGDNCYNKEYGIKDEDIIAVMSGFTRKGKEYTVDNKGYKLYSRVWYFLYPARRLMMYMRMKLRRIIKREK